MAGSHNHAAVQGRPSFVGALLIAAVIGVIGLMITMTVAEEPRVGTLEGVVVDDQARPVPGAIVTVPAVNDEQQDVRTDANGRWRAARVPVGSHAIFAQRRGYQFREFKVKDLREGQVLEMPLQIYPAQPYLSLGVYYPQSVAPGRMKGLYLSGMWGEEKARVTLRVYAYDQVQAILAGPDSYSVREQFIAQTSRQREPLYEWERTYTTDEKSGSFAAEPATPRIDKPGTYMVVAELGDMRAGDILNVTRLAVVTKRDAQQTLAWLTDIESGEPVSGAEVALYDGRQPVQQSLTDSDGLARFTYDREAALAVARHQGSVAFTSSYSYQDDFGNDSLLYTDRPLYRPGHVVRFKGIFRQRQGGTYNVLSSRPVEWAIEDPNGQRVGTVTTSTGAMGTASGSWKSPPSARLGMYRLSVNLDGKVYDTRFSIEEYRKPEYSVGIDIPKQTYIQGQNIRAAIRANYYFGAPVANAQVNYRIYRSNWYFWDYESEFESWYDDLYGDYGYDFGGYGELVREGTGRTNDAGELVVDIDTTGEEESSRWVIEASVVDVSMREVTSSAGANVVPAALRIQVEPRGWLHMPGRAVHFEVSTRDWDGGVMPDQKLTAVVEQRRWLKNKERRERVATVDVSTGKAGSGTFTWTAGREGDFVVTVTGKDDQGRTATGEAYVWVADREYEGPEAAPDDLLTVIQDRKVYQKGDTARLLVRSREGPAKVLMTVEAETLLRSEVLSLDGGSRTVELALTQEHLPNANVTFSYVRNGRMRSARAAIAVAPDDAFLTVKVDSDRQRYKPGETATYTIRTLDSEGQGVPAEVSLGVVDESIYALRADSTPDIQKHFWGPRYPLVTTSTSIEDYFYGGVDKFSDEVRKDFKDTAFWEAAVQTDASGNARVAFKMPDNLTTWRATARAVTESTQVGSATQKVTVSKDLIVRLQTPRFFRMRDKQSLGLMVHNYTDREQSVRLSLEADGLKVSGRAARQVRVPANGVERVDLQAEAVRPGQSRLVARATGAGDARDALQLELPIYQHGVQAVSAAAGRSGQAVSVTLPSHADPATAEMTVSVTPSAAGAVIEGLEYLARYPWGCVEQTVSSFVPDVVVQRAIRELGVSLPSLERDLPEMLSTGLKRLADMQQPDGSWGWYQESQADLEMTSYVLFALNEARRAGVNVPEAMWARAVDWARSYQFGPLPVLVGDDASLYRYELQKRALALMGLASAGVAQPAQFDALLERQNHLTDLALAALGMTASQLGLERELGQIAGLLEDRRKSTEGLWYWSGSGNAGYWTGKAASAMALRVLSRAGWSAADLEPAVRWLVINRTGSHWENTRETALVALALVEHLEAAQRDPVAASVYVNGQKVEDVNFTSSDYLGPVRKIDVDRSLTKRGRNSVEVRTAAGGPVFYSAVLRYMDTQEDLPARSGFFKVTRKFYRVSVNPVGYGQYEEKLEPLKGTVRLGETIRCRLTVEPDTEVSYVLIESPLPSGFEVVERERQWHFGYSGTEVHDEKIGIFSRYLSGGRRTIDFDLRPEVAGDIHVMPVTVEAMYAPSLTGRSAEDRMEVK